MRKEWVSYLALVVVLILVNVTFVCVSSDCVGQDKGMTKSFQKSKNI